MVNEWSNVLHYFLHHVLNLILLLLHINLNQKILCYSVKHFQTYVKFSYRTLAQLCTEVINVDNHSTILVILLQ